MDTELRQQKSIFNELVSITLNLEHYGPHPVQDTLHAPARLFRGIRSMEAPGGLIRPPNPAVAQYK